jgi:hypothetical protein
MSSRVIERGRRTLLVIALMLAPGLAQAEAAQTPLPEGFPAALAVPWETPAVFLTGSAHVIGADGQRKPHARTCEFSRTHTAEATRLMNHYLALFAAEGWEGEIERQDEVRQGSFQRDEVKVTVHLRPRAGGVLAFTMKVMVLER